MEWKEGGQANDAPDQIVHGEGGVESHSAALGEAADEDSVGSDACLFLIVD